MTATGPHFAFFEGQIVPIEQAKVSVMTHGLNYGTAAFGGIRAYWNTKQDELYIFRPLDHFARLCNSGKMLLIDVPYTPEQLRDTLSTCCARRLPRRRLHTPAGLQVLDGHRGAPARPEGASSPCLPCPLASTSRPKRA